MDLFDILLIVLVSVAGVACNLTIVVGILAIVLICCRSATKDNHADFEEIK
jgi:hypothetical protein